MHNGDDFIKDNILKSLEHAKLFEAYKTRKMVSLWDSYSVDKIICQYVREVESSTEDIQDWMQENCKSVSGLSLILPSDEEGRKALEKFAQAVCSVEGFYPIREENKDIAIDYFMDEYGCAGGDEI